MGAALLPLAAAGSSQASELAARLALLMQPASCSPGPRGWLAHYFSRPMLVGYSHAVAVVLVSAIALGALLVARFFLPRLPGALIVVLASILVSWAVDLEAHGVAVVGPIPSGLPSFSIPRPPLGDAVDLVPAVIGIFLVCFADGIPTARSFAGKQNQHIRANQSSSPSRG